MTNAEVLKKGRDTLLSLHKSLVDAERALHEGIHGPVTATQFLNLLLEDPDFAWLRKFSTLIVDIDEMFAQRDGFAEESVMVHLTKMRDLVLFHSDDEVFIAKYKAALQQDREAAAKQGELRGLLA
jgi:hypothetical protein